MSSQHSRMPSAEELQTLRQQALKVPFSLEELTELSHLFQEPSFKLWLRYLQQLEEHLQEEVWRSDTLEKLAFTRGRRDTLVRLKRAPEEISQAREQLNIMREERINGNI